MGIVLVIFAGVFMVALWIVHERELACAGRCSVKGYMNYEYKGFSGAGRTSLKSDICTCINTDGSSERFMGSSLGLKH